MKTLKRIAGIDIGTNTVLMVIADILENHSLKMVHNEHSIARLGEKVSEGRIIIPEAIDRTIEILRKFRAICEEMSVNAIYTVATSAMREAENSDNVKKMFSEVLGSEIKIISGEEEARLSFLGTVETDELSTVIDIGGGSTEFITGKDGNIISRKSLPIGALKITEKYYDKHPPSAENLKYAENNIISEIRKISILDDSNKYYAVAGTPTTIAAVALGLRNFQYDKIHGYKLNINKIAEIYSLFLNNTISDIIDKFGINPKRADIITAGTQILKSSMEYFDINELIVSAHGLRYGVVINEMQKLFR